MLTREMALALGGGEVLIGHQPGTALRAGVFGVFQDALDHVFVPLSRVLVVADASSLTPLPPMSWSSSGFGWNKALPTLTRWQAC